MAVRVALAVITIVILAYSVFGVVMTRTLISDMRARAIAKVQTPGQLLQQQALRYDSLANRATMTQLLGEDLVDGVLVGRNKVIFHDLNPKRLGQLITSVPGFDPGWFLDSAINPILVEEMKNGQVILTSITPIFIGDSKIPYFHAVVRVALAELASKEAALTRWFIAVGLISAILVIAGVMGAFRILVLGRVKYLSEVATRIGSGDLTARVDHIGTDELGALEFAMGDMAESLRTSSRERNEAITALTASEHRFRDFTEVSSDWLWELDSELRFIFLSDQYEKSFGVLEEFVLGKTPIEDVLNTNVDPETLGLHMEDIRAHRQFSNLTFQKTHPTDGSATWVSISGKPVFDEHRKFSGYRGTGSDITVRKNLETQLYQSQRMDAVGQLTGGVAHDFNNLLAVMMGNLEVALDKADTNEPLRNSIELTLDAVDRAAVLTQQLLTFSRQQILSPKTGDANELISETLKLLDRTLRESIKIESRFLYEDLWINIDPALFGNALLNLALNASDAMSEGGTLTITATSIDLNGESLWGNNQQIRGSYVLITVSDTGVGICSENIERAMEPFFTTKAVGQGSGLGLSMVYGFVKQSKGYIGINSHLGVGTTISLCFPRSEEAPQIQKEQSPPENIAENKKTVLLVEDDPQVRETTAFMLSSLGYVVIEAEDGPTALDVLDQRSSEIDIVFSDVVMPNNMSGPELAKLVADKHQGIRFLLTSGYPDRVTGHRTVKALGIDVLAKPYKRIQLAAAVEKATSSPAPH